MYNSISFLFYIYFYDDNLEKKNVFYIPHFIKKLVKDLD